MLLDSIAAKKARQGIVQRIAMELRPSNKLRKVVGRIWAIILHFDGRLRDDYDERHVMRLGCSLLSKLFHWPRG